MRIPFAKPSLGDEEKDAAIEAMEGRFIGSGQTTEALTGLVSKSTGSTA